MPGWRGYVSARVGTGVVANAAISRRWRVLSFFGPGADCRTVCSAWICQRRDEPMMNRRITGALLMAIASATTFASPRYEGPQVPQPAGTGIIAGVTVDQTTGRPLGGVAVELRFYWIERDTWIEPRATSDTRGRFAFRDLPQGEWSLNVRLDGWLGAPGVSEDSEEDEGFFMSSQRLLGQGQRIQDVRLGLRKYAVVTGRVIDGSGAPIALATVSAMSYRAVAGRQMLVSGPSADADANGVYRFTWLTAGEYVLTASVGFTRMKEAGTPPASDRLVYQRAPSRTVALHWGQTLAPINFTLQTAPAVRVSGQVTGASSFRTKGYVHLQWTDPLEREDHLFVAYSYLDAHGNFSMAPVPPGRYVLATYGAQADSGRMLWTRQPVVVGATDIADLEVPIEIGRRLSGRIQFDGALRRPSADELAQVSVALLEPEVLNVGDVMPPRATVRPDGTFTSAEMTSGRYVVRVWGLPEGWTLRSAMVDGIDAADAPIEMTTDVGGAVLTFTDRAARIRGRVLDGNGQPAAAAHVLIFPAIDSLWTDFGPARRLRRVITGKDGSYELQSLPAGDYLVAAVASVPRSGWRDQALLSVLAPSATRISLVEGSDLSQALRLVPR